MKKRLMVNLLFELIKNSKRSDRKLARSLSLWPSTITRYRKKLEKDGIILEYTLIPNLQKMGYEILAFLFVKKPKKTKISHEAWSKKMREWLSDFPEVIFSIELAGEWDALIISLHKDFTGSSRYMRKFLKMGDDFIEDTNLLLASLVEKLTLKPFSLKYLEKEHSFR